MPDISARTEFSPRHNTPLMAFTEGWEIMQKRNFPWRWTSRRLQATLWPTTGDSLSGSERLYFALALLMPSTSLRHLLLRAFVRRASTGSSRATSASNGLTTSDQAVALSSRPVILSAKALTFHRLKWPFFFVRLNRSRSIYNKSVEPCDPSQEKTALSSSTTPAIPLDTDSLTTNVSGHWMAARPASSRTARKPSA